MPDADALRSSYDLFISYAHRDDRSGWLTAFVQALREALSVKIQFKLPIA